MRRTGLVVAVCVLTAGLLGACANAPEPGGRSSGAAPADPPPAPGAPATGAPAPASGATAEQLVGTWVVDTTFDAPNQPYLTIRPDGSWAGSDGCNAVRGTWDVSGDGTLTVEAGPSTLMACEGKPLPALFAGATSASVVTVAGRASLTLVGATGTATTLVAGREHLTPIVPPAD
jgi:heat shock protein HslJ